MPPSPRPLTAEPEPAGTVGERIARQWCRSPDDFYECAAAIDAALAKTAEPGPVGDEEVRAALATLRQIATAPEVTASQRALDQVALGSIHATLGRSLAEARTENDALKHDNATLLKAAGEEAALVTELQAENARLKAVIRQYADDYGTDEWADPHLQATRDAALAQKGET